MTEKEILTFTTRMPAALIARLDALAAKKGMSRNAMINEMADSYERFSRYDELIESVQERVVALEKEIFKNRK